MGRRRASRAATVGVLMAMLVLAGCGGAAGPPPAKLPFHQRGEPTGAYAGKPPRALIILLRGGGWRGPEPGVTRQLGYLADYYRAQGYETLNADYRAGPAGFADVLRFYDRARRRVGEHEPICAVGESAGAHLALMLAVRRASLDCVVSLAGPTDLTHLGGAPESRATRALAIDAFGRDHLAAWSPALHADRIHARLLLVEAANDPLVAVSQGRRMVRAKPGARLIVLPPGTRGFVHSRVSLAAGLRAVAAENRFLPRSRPNEAELSPSRAAVAPSSG